MDRNVRDVIYLIVAIAVIGVVTGLLLRGNAPQLSKSTVTSITTTTATTTVLARPQNTTPPSFFGMSIDFSNTNAWPPVSIGTLGATDGTSWSYVEKQNGVYNWTSLDSSMAKGKANGVSQFVYIFYNTPQWASSQPGQSCDYGMLLGCSAPPSNLSYWDQYVNSVVTRYKGRITYYELWYEPDNQQWWSGNTVEMMLMAKDAYGIIKSIDPNAVVLTPGVSASGTGPYYPGCNPSTCWLASYLFDGGGKYADGVAWHGSFCAGGLNGTCLNSLGCTDALNCAGQPLLTQIGNIKNAMNQTGNGKKPIFDTQGGWGANQDLEDQNKEAAYLARWYILQDSAGVKAAIWYEWGDFYGAKAYGTQVSMPLVTQAYLQTYTWLVGSNMSQPCTVYSNLWSCYITLKDGAGALFLWSNQTNMTTQYTPPDIYTRYQGLNGTFAQISPGQTVDVGYRPILLQP